MKGTRGTALAQRGRPSAESRLNLVPHTTPEILSGSSVIGFKSGGNISRNSGGTTQAFFVDCAPKGIKVPFGAILYSNQCVWKWRNCYGKSHTDGRLGP